jgi:mutator protein MutT
MNLGCGERCDMAATRVVAAVIEQDERLLLCQRLWAKHHGGLWEFPGGKVRKGEDLAAAARRELAEELGVAVVAVGETLFSRQDPGTQFLIEFVAVAIEGTPEALEHVALAWVSRDQLADLPLAPIDSLFAQVVVHHKEQ